jgi:succinyl-CoA synthetase alpha subunit
VKASGDHRRPRHEARRPGPHRARGLVPRLRNRGYGTTVVAGVTPGKGGQDVEGVPVFDTVADAVARRARTRR